MADPKSLLLVEDDAPTRELFRAFLELEGYTVRQAADGRDALEQLGAGPPPDCILLDLRMPGMDGRAFRAAQRQDPRWAQIPVVVVSAEPRLAEEAASLGAAGYLRKPVEPSALLDAVHQHC
jgi:two-component system response regulator MprA